MNAPLAQQHAMNVPLPRNVFKLGTFGPCASGPEASNLVATKLFHVLDR